MKKIKIAVFGLGRMGSVHLKNIINQEECTASYIYDINESKLNFFKKKYNLNSPQNILNDIYLNKDIDAIFITTPTNTHLKFILDGIKYNKNIFCEKPIDLNINKINKLKNLCNSYKKVLQLGFNRRFDKTIAHLISNTKSGVVGNVEKVIITSRDKNAPSYNYLKTSGGILRDCSIHDIDLLRQIFGKDEIQDAFCFGSNLFDRNTKKLKDFDTIVSIFKTKKNKIGIINNSRHSAYGYDQRIEVFGIKGMIQTKNINENFTSVYNNKKTNSKEKYLNFFLERYEDSFKKELDTFVSSIKKKKSVVTFEDCRKALVICECLYRSIKTKKSEKVFF